MARLQELTERPTRLTGGHRLCPGCGEPIVVRQVLMSTSDPVIAASCTGCLEVSTTIFPYTAWDIPWIHIAFENAAATIAGIEAMYKALKTKAEKDQPLPDYIDPDADYKFVTFAGDGGTYDIGIQSLSGAAERGHDFLYICLNNEAYMNTGIQRSSATPMGANTTTSPAGGKRHPRQAQAPQGPDRGYGRPRYPLCRSEHPGALARPHHQGRPWL